MNTKQRFLASLPTWAVWAGGGVLMLLGYQLQLFVMPVIRDGTASQQYWAHLGSAIAWMLCFVGLGVLYLKHKNRWVAWVPIGFMLLMVLTSWFITRNQRMVRVGDGAYEIINP